MRSRDPIRIRRASKPEEQVHVEDDWLAWRPRQDSNLRNRLRRPKRFVRCVQSVNLNGPELGFLSGRSGSILSVVPR
jgi:hypothetical protein